MEEEGTANNQNVNSQHVQNRKCMFSVPSNLQKKIITASTSALRDRVRRIAQLRERHGLQQRLQAACVSSRSQDLWAEGTAALSV